MSNVGVSGPIRGYQGSSTSHIKGGSLKGENVEPRRRVRCPSCGKLTYKKPSGCFFCGALL